MTDEIKAVAYYRMSSDKQEASIDDQRTAVVAFAASNGYKITGEYVDEGISGWKSGDQRGGFQRLIAAAERKEFQAVLCWDQDRFSRFPVLEANHYWYLLDRAGVHITTIAQGRLNFEDLGEWLKASVVQHGKAEYVRDLARNTTRGLRKCKLAGRWIGPAPIGYRLSEGRLALGDESHVELVRRIFSMRAKGLGTHAIAKALNADGIETPRGGANWHTNSIRHVLQRDAYLGHTVIGKHARGTYERITAEPVTLENTHPPIIDRATWDAAQGVTKFIRRGNGVNGPAALSGLLKCGRCGEAMYSVTFTKWDYYLCSSYHGKGKCGHCAVRRQPLLKAVAAKIREHILLGSPARLEEAIQRQLDKRRPATTDRAALARKLATLDRKIARAGDRLLAVDDALVGGLEKQLLGMTRQRNQLSASIDATPAPTRQQSAKAIAARVWELDRVFTSAPAAAVGNALRQIIAEIRLDFQPAGETRRGKRYAFTGGVIRLLPNASLPSETWSS
jgi:DNA invertase Pin-like site-specific DNA recombinase